MSEREELVDILFQTATADRVRDGKDLKRVPVVMGKVEETADAILAAGYRKAEAEPDWDSVAAREDLIRMLNEYRDSPTRVTLPRFAVNMLLDKVAELTARTAADGGPNSAK